MTVSALQEAAAASGAPAPLLGPADAPKLALHHEQARGGGNQSGTASCRRPQACQMNRAARTVIESNQPPPVRQRRQEKRGPKPPPFRPRPPTPPNQKVSILFADVVGFTAMSEAQAPAAVMALLNDLFTRWGAVFLGREAVAWAGCFGSSLGCFPVLLELWVPKKTPKPAQVRPLAGAPLRLQGGDDRGLLHGGRGAGLHRRTGAPAGGGEPPWERGGLGA